MGRKFGTFLLVLLAFGAGIGATIWYLGGRSERARVVFREQPLSRETPIPVQIQTQPAGNQGPIAEAAARVEPSVVTIDTEYRPRARYGAGEMFGFGGGPQAIPRGTGSGVIISADGIIVTNNHVVANASRINVTLHDGRELEGEVIGADPQTDLAVVRVSEKNLPAVTLADSDNLRVGEWVVAVGNPLGIGMTVTAGIISAIRKGASASRAPVGVDSLIQTDAAINPGNSGGALADMEGRLIGINTAIASNNGGNIGIGFAIPVNTVRTITAQLIENGRVARPWIGIAYGPITDRARQVLNIPGDVEGMIIGGVMPDGPAAQAGLQVGDVLRRVNEQPIREAKDLQNAIEGLSIGSVLRLTVWRQGAEQNVSVTLRERPNDMQMR